MFSQRGIRYTNLFLPEHMTVLIPLIPLSRDWKVSFLQNQGWEAGPFGMRDPGAGSRNLGAEPQYPGSQWLFHRSWKTGSRATPAASRSFGSPSLLSAKCFCFFFFKLERTHRDAFSFPFSFLSPVLFRFRSRSHQRMRSRSRSRIHLRTVLEQFPFANRSQLSILGV